MKPSDKAKELVKKFKTYAIDMPISYESNVVINGYITFESAKQCALIAVEELINESDGYSVTLGRGNKYPTDKEYWNEVKTEINLL